MKKQITLGVGDRLCSRFSAEEVTLNSRRLSRRVLVSGLIRGGRLLVRSEPQPFVPGMQAAVCHSMERSHCQNLGNAPLGALYMVHLKIKTSVCFFVNSVWGMYFPWGPLHGSSEVFSGKLMGAPCWLSGAWWCVRVHLGTCVLCVGAAASKDSLLSLFTDSVFASLSTCRCSFVTPKSVPGCSHGLLWTCAEWPGVALHFCLGSATQTSRLWRLERAGSAVLEALGSWPHVDRASSFLECLGEEWPWIGCLTCLNLVFTFVK